MVISNVWVSTRVSKLKLTGKTQHTTIFFLNWSTLVSVHLCINYTYLLDAMAKLSSHDRNGMVCKVKNICYLTFCRRKFVHCFIGALNLESLVCRCILVLITMFLRTKSHQNPCPHTFFTFLVISSHKILRLFCYENFTPAFSNIFHSQTQTWV